MKKYELTVCIFRLGAFLHVLAVLFTINSLGRESFLFLWPLVILCLLGALLIIVSIGIQKEKSKAVLSAKFISWGHLVFSMIPLVMNLRGLALNKHSEVYLLLVIASSIWMSIIWGLFIPCLLNLMKKAEPKETGRGL